MAPPMTLASLTADDVIDRLLPHAEAMRQAGIPDCPEGLDLAAFPGNALARA